MTGKVDEDSLELSFPPDEWEDEEDEEEKELLSEAEESPTFLLSNRQPENRESASAAVKTSESIFFIFSPCADERKLYFQYIIFGGCGQYVFRFLCARKGKKGYKLRSVSPYYF